MDPDLLAESVITINSNSTNNNNTNERKRKRSNEEDEEELLSNRAKKARPDLSQTSGVRAMNQSTASIQVSCEDEAFMTVNTTSLQISEEEEDSKANIIIETKPLQLVLSAESKEEPIDSQSVSSSSTASMFSKFKFAGLKKYAKAFEENGYDDLDYLIELVGDENEFKKMLTLCGVDKPGHVDQLKKSLMALKSQNK